MNVLSLFDGMSCGQIALHRAGIKYKNYYASEIDPYAIAVAQHNYPKTIQVGDVTLLTKSKLPKIDLVIGGSPCQDLSRLSNGLGLQGQKSGLLLHFRRLIKECKPKAFLLENVVPRRLEWKFSIDELLNVSGVFINSDLFVPQNRPRVYWTNIKILELPQRPNWKSAYWQYRRTYFRSNKSGVCPCLTANMGTGGHNVPLKSPNLKDKLTVEEVEVLQGVPQNYTSCVTSRAQRYKMLGNGWTVDVVAHIFRGLKL